MTIVTRQFVINNVCIFSLWIGVELDTNMGKNDGSVNGIRYFCCKPNHGIFAHPSKFVMYVIKMLFMISKCRNWISYHIFHNSEKDVQERSSLAKSKDISISDDAINQPQQTVNDDSGINRDKTKSRLSLLNRRLSNSVPDLTQKRHKQYVYYCPLMRLTIVFTQTTKLISSKYCLLHILLQRHIRWNSFETKSYGSLHM